MGPPASVAACRTAVRHAVADLLGGQRHPTVVVAVSGGPDSTALLHACCFALPRLGVRVAALTVDHGLQEGSGHHARAVAASAARLGAEPVAVWHAVVTGSGGPEAAARAARLTAYETTARAWRADAVLLGHTRDDQAETVLLGLARGSGARSLAGMAPVAGRLRRPFLGLPRAEVLEAARASGTPVWDDPHNADPSFARARARHRVLPVLEDELGPGVAAALARTARLLRADADALEQWAAAEARKLAREPGDLDAVALAALPEAVRTRVLRHEALRVGCPAGDLAAAHVTAMDALLSVPSGTATVDLPGRVQATVVGGRLMLDRR
jgi:tRNA(Ile)-lysidine synthase